MGQHADEHAAERAADWCRRAWTLDDADRIAGVDDIAVGDDVGSEHPDQRRDDHALRYVEQLSVVRATHVRAPPIVSTASGVAMPYTATSGTVRLATPAIIDPCPTSKNAVAPSAARASIEPRQRTGRVTWCARRARQP